MLTLAWSLILASVQDGAKKPPPPLQELVADASQDYASLAFSPKGGVLAAGANGQVRILRIPEPGKGKVTEAKALKHRGRVDELLFDDAGRALVSRSDPETLVWQADSWAPLKYALEDATLFPPTFPAAGSMLVFPHRSRGILLWQADGLLRKPRSVLQREVREWGGVGIGHVTASAGSETDSLLGDDQGFLYRLAAASTLFGVPPSPQVPAKAPHSAARALIFRPHAGEVTSIGLASKAGRCVTSGMDGKVRLWELSKIPMTAPNARPVVLDPQWEIDGQAAELSADGKLLAVANGDGVGVYLASSGTMLSWNPTSASGGRVVRLRFEGAGKALAAIVCRCAECGPANRVELIRMRRRLADHGGGLVLWR